MTGPIRLASVPRGVLGLFPHTTYRVCQLVCQRRASPVTRRARGVPGDPRLLARTPRALRSGVGVPADTRTKKTQLVEQITHESSLNQQLVNACLHETFVPTMEASVCQWCDNRDQCAGIGLDDREGHSDNVD